MLLFEQLIGRAPMGGNPGLVRFDPVDLGSQPGDTLIQFLDRQWVEVFLAELDDRLAGLEVILLVHCRQR